jgi:4-hydroxybenzoate polyprenyltransferase
MPTASYPLRTFLQRLLGEETVAYLLHLRPMEWPIMTAHFMLGTLVAVGWSLPWKDLCLGWFVFVALLNGGTLAINSAFDKDEGDIGYLRNPPKPPKYLFPVSALMLAASLLMGFLLPPVFAWSNAACVVMAILYSVPPIRLKARAGWDMAINCVGFGLLTPLAGWGLTGRSLTAAFVHVAIGFAFLFGSLYPLTQIYQIDEDRQRGDRTLVIKLGETRSLGMALVLAITAHGWFCSGLLQMERVPWFLAFSLAAWLGVLIPWLAHWQSWSQARQEAGMYWALGAWAITDISMVLMMWPR